MSDEDVDNTATMDNEPVNTDPVVTTDEQPIETVEAQLKLREYVSVQRRHGRDIDYLDLRRVVKRGDTVEELTNNVSVGGVCLSQNYLFQLPAFVSEYTNLTDVDASHNELYEAEFLLYKPLDHGRSTTKTSNRHIQQQTTESLVRPLIHPFLEHVNLSYNHIQSLPSTIHYLRFLRTLDLSHNYLTALPTRFGDIERLETLKLNHNSLTSLPVTFTRLVHLKRLNLSKNRFQSVDMIKNLPQLIVFNISSNPLTSFPLLLSTCSNLEEILLANTNLNQATELTLEYFHQFPRLKKLDLSKNQLEDRFLDSASSHSWHSLEDLHVQHNHFTNIDALLSQLKGLQSLDLTSNCLTGVPANPPSTLTSLRLSSNQIELQSDDCIHLKYVIQLDLDRNQIRHIPHEFLQCFQLQSLNISSNPLVEFPEVLLRLRSLQRLVYQSCQLKALLPRDFFEKHQLRSLTTLNLSHQQLKTDLNELTVLQKLTDLDLSYNQLYALDEDFRLFTCLQALRLNHNKFVEFPTWLYQMSDEKGQQCIGETLVELYINNNQIKLIPEDIIHMTRLEILDLSNNPLPGFPEPLIYLEQLTALHYSQASGIHIDTLPDDFSNLYQLKTLDLSHNSFLDVPSVIYQLRQLEHLDLSENLFSGIDINRLKHLKTIKLNGNNCSQFPALIYRFESSQIHDNPTCFAPPNDLIHENNTSALANLYVETNDQYDEKLFLVYQQILVEFLPTVDIERLLIRLKLSDGEVEEFRSNSTFTRREEKVDMLLRLWKDKRHSLATAEALYRLTKIIGDKRILQHIQKAHILAQRIRM